jgi:hypothetical protein
MGAVTASLASCATTPLESNPQTSCYHPHWAIPFDIGYLRRVTQEPFTAHTGSKLYLTIFEPGPFERSLYFVMSPDTDPDSVARSANKGVMLDSDRDGKPDCFILGGGTLPDARGKPVAYNFFAIDREGQGQIDEFISEDLDLDGDRIMDRNAQAILTEPDPNGHFRKGAYYVNGTITPIPKEGFDFLLKKPLYKDPFPFADDEVTKLTLFAALQKIWDDLQHPQ